MIIWAVAGTLFAAYIGLNLEVAANFKGAPSVLAIIVMGSFILGELRKQNKK